MKWQTGCWYCLIISLSEFCSVTKYLQRALWPPWGKPLCRVEQWGCDASPAKWSKKHPTTSPVTFCSLRNLAFDPRHRVQAPLPPPALYAFVLRRSLEYLWRRLEKKMQTRVVRPPASLSLLCMYMCVPQKNINLAPAPRWPTGHFILLFALAICLLLRAVKRLLVPSKPKRR